jgi:hypothetical protein
MLTTVVSMLDSIDDYEPIDPAQSVPVSSDSGHTNMGETTSALPPFPASYGAPERIRRFETDVFPRRFAAIIP